MNDNPEAQPSGDALVEHLQNQVDANLAGHCGTCRHADKIKDGTDPSQRICVRFPPHTQAFITGANKDEVTGQLTPQVQYFFVPTFVDVRGRCAEYKVRLKDKGNA